MSAKSISEDDVAEFKKIASDHKFAKILFHAPYILNSCSADPKIRELAFEIMSEDIRRDYLNYSHEYLSVPARMLYGHLMVGLEPVERNDETEENKFPNQQTVFWDADAKTAVFDIRPAPYHWS